MPIADYVNILDSQDIDTAHLPKIKTRPDWLKPADALAKSYKDLEENKLLSKTEDMGLFIKWFCIRIGKKKLSKSDLEVPTFKDASDFLFKEDYITVSKPRVVIYRDRNDQKKMLRENEVHKFSDGTLIRVLHKLNHMVKDFRLFKYNLGMKNRIWSEDDKRMSEEFMEDSRSGESSRV
nr:hypothetical protein [Tanacetum cinerariifolium]